MKDDGAKTREEARVGIGHVRSRFGSSWMWADGVLQLQKTPDLKVGTVQDDCDTTSLAVLSVR